MRKESSIFKSIIGTCLLLGIFYYGIYVSPLGEQDRIHEEKIKDVKVEMSLPARYDVTNSTKNVDLFVRGTKEMMENIGDKKPVVMAEIDEEEGKQKASMIVKGLEGYIYELGKDYIEVDVFSVEPEYVKPTISVVGSNKLKIKKVELEEDINIYMNSNTERELEEVKVEIDITGIEDNGKITGKITPYDKNGKELDKEILDKEEVGVYVKVK